MRACRMVGAGAVVCAVGILLAGASVCRGAEVQLYSVSHPGILARTLYGAALDGSGERVTDAESGYGVGVDPVNGKLYYSTTHLISDRELYRANLDGSGRQVFLDNWAPVTYDLDPARNRIFFGIGFYAYVADLTNPAPRQVNLGLNAIVDVQYDAVSDRLFIANASPSGEDNIWSFKVDGGPASVNVFDNLRSLRGLSVDTVNRKLYYSAGFSPQSTETVIWRSELDGSGAQIWVDNTAAGLSQVYDVDVLPELNAIFWSDEGMGGVWRANLDGTGITRLMLHGSGQIAVLAPEPAAVMMMGLMGVVMGWRKRRERL